MRETMFHVDRLISRAYSSLVQHIPHVKISHVLFLATLICGGVSFWFAYELRFDFDVPLGYREQCWALVPYVAITKALIFYLLGGLATNWRFVGLRDSFVVLIHSMVSAGLLFCLWLFSESLRVPRGVIIIDAFLCFVLTGGARFAPRFLREQLLSVRRNGNGQNARRCMIIGAGDAGEMVAREIRRNPASGYNLLAFFDDDSSKKGMLIHGIRVVGDVKHVKSYAQQFSIDTVIVAIPSATRRQMTRINDELKGLRLSIKTLPPLLEIMDKSPALQQLRDINITDLLGRGEVRIDTRQVHDLIYDKTVLVTGAGGSIGSELCRQVIRQSPRRLILVDHSENNLFHVHRDLSRRAVNGRATDLVPLLCDVADKVQMPYQVSKYRPQLVLHAAAHKHVNMQEMNPVQCFKNNVGGLRNLVKACDAAQVERFLLVSTDKAVNPRSVMGATKRVCEIYCQAMGQMSSTKFMSVRFGNVLASEGSVVPIFMEQISAGGPITVTHPDVRRYFMTIPEAVTLILQATAIGKSGQIMILNMGEPIRIVDLARQLIELTGADPDSIGIQFTGLKEGEKLTEELFCEGEVCAKTAHEKIHIFDKQVFNPNSMLATIEEAVERVEKTANNLDIRVLLKKIVPEYSPTDNPGLHASNPDPPKPVDSLDTADCAKLDLKSTGVL